MRPQSSFQMRFWLIFFLITGIIVWALHPMLLPFVCGLAIAYFLDPVVELLVKRKWPRWLSATCILTGFIAGIFLIMALIVPVLRDQGGALIQAAPGYMDTIRIHYLPGFQRWLGHVSPDLKAQVQNSAGKYAGDAAGFISSGVSHLIDGGLALIDILSFLIITPIVAFYMMRDWPKMMRHIDTQIPRRYYDVIHKEIDAIDDSLSGFVRGQSLVCASLGAYYAAGLSLAGMDYGLSIGVLAGVLSFVPYLGTGFAWIASITLATLQFEDSSRIGIIVSILVVGNLLESYVLTPRLIGSRVGLHPVWLLFALLAGAQLLGFLGVLIAVPAAAVIGVLIRFGLRQYRGSAIYKDTL